MLISIVMPAYNAEKYIKTAISSVISQTYQEWELLVMDDGSRDQTSDIVKSYMATDQRIYYYPNQENMGVCAARNKGIEKSHGDWIAFLDSDDCWDSHKLEIQVKAIKQYGARFLYTGSAFMDDSGKQLDYILSVPEQIGYHELLKQNVISCSSVLIEKNLMLQYPMKQGDRLHEDFAVWLQILKNEVPIAYGIDRPLLIYRVNQLSKSGNKKKAAWFTFRVYRYVGLSFFTACYYFCFYTARNLRKYKKIWNKQKEQVKGDA